jgi:hypothetical protein
MEVEGPGPGPGDGEEKLYIARVFLDPTPVFADSEFLGEIFDGESEDADSGLVLCFTEDCLPRLLESGGGYYSASASYYTVDPDSIQRLEGNAEECSAIIRDCGGARNHDEQTSFDMFKIKRRDLFPVDQHPMDTGDVECGDIPRMVASGSTVVITGLLTCLGVIVVNEGRGAIGGHFVIPDDMFCKDDFTGTGWEFINTFKELIIAHNWKSGDMSLVVYMNDSPSKWGVSRMKKQMEYTKRVVSRIEEVLGVRAEVRYTTTPKKSVVDYTVP